MRTLRTLPVWLVTALLMVAPGLVVAGNEVAEDLAVVVNPAVPISRLSATDLEGIFTATRRTWADGTNIAAFSYAPEDAIRHVFDQAVLRMSTDEVGRFWLDQRIRGGARPPRQVPDPSLALRLVGKLPGTIAYVPGSMVNASVKVVARIKNGKIEAP